MSNYSPNEAQRLALFADVILDILQRDEEWNDDTISEIGDIAIQRGLATVNPDTMLFERITKHEN